MGRARVRVATDLLIGCQGVRPCSEKGTREGEGTGVWWGASSTSLLPLTSTTPVVSRVTSGEIAPALTMTTDCTPLCATMRFTVSSISLDIPGATRRWLLSLGLLCATSAGNANRDFPFSDKYREINKHRRTVRPLPL